MRVEPRSRIIAKLFPLVFLAIIAGSGCGTQPWSGTAMSHENAHHNIKPGKLALPDSPTCSSASATPPSSVSMQMSTSDDAFSQSCYYAPANQGFTINFTNNLMALSDNSPITIILYIAPSSSPVFQADPNNPGLSYGIGENAVFISDPIVAPATVALDIPALPAGTYDVQTNIRPLEVIATLTVG